MDLGLRLLLSLLLFNIAVPFAGSAWKIAQTRAPFLDIVVGYATLFTVLAVLPLWPLLTQAWLLRFGVAVPGHMISDKSPGMAGLVVYEYRELADPPTERLQGRMLVFAGQAAFERVQASGELSVFYSRWSPRRSVAAPFAMFRVVD